MAQTLINVGVIANDGTGDEIRRAGIYINANFTEVFALPPIMASIRFDGNNIITNSSNANIDLKPSGTGAIQLGDGIQIDDNNIKAIRSNDDIKFIPQGSGGVAISGIKVASNNIYATRSNDDLVFSPSGSGNVVFGALQFSGNNITATRSNDDIKITPSGTGDVVLSSLRVNGTTLDSSDSSKITFAETVDVTGALLAATSINIAGDGATVTGILDEDAMGSDSNVKLATQQSIKAYTDNKVGLEKLTMQGDNAVERLIYLGSETWTWAGSGGVTADGSSNTMTVNLNSATGLTTLGMGSLTFAGNDITSSSNADINITSGGTGAVNMSNTTIDGNINLFDNTIQTTQSNSDLIISGSGTGQAVITKTDMNSGTVDNTTIGVTTPAAGTFTVFTTPTLSSSQITITDNVIKANSSNADLSFEASGSGYVVMEGYQFPTADGGTGQLLTTNASKQLSWGESGISLGSSDIQDGMTTIGFTSETTIDAITATGAHELVQSGAVTVNSFLKTKYDSAWYLAVTREENDTDTEPQSFATAKFSMLHDNTNASITTTNVTKTDSDTHISATADISGTLCRLRGTGATSANAVSFYRIGLGDDDSTGSQTIDGTGKASVIINTDIDSTVENLDTWAHASFRGAKYYISCNNTTNGEISNLECILTHGISPDGSTHDAFISVYNEHYSGNNSLITLTADVSGSDVRLRGSASPNTRVHAYRILLGDAESTTTSGNLKLIGATTVNNSAETTIDADHSRGSSTADFLSQKTITQWTSTDFDSAWYYYVTKDQTNNHWEVGKYSLLHGTTSDGSTLDAFVTDSHNTRTGSFSIITVDADISSGDARLLGTGNNDGSTTISDSISYYKIGLGDNTVTGTSGNITKSSTTIGVPSETSIDAISSTGSHSLIPNSETIITTFPKTQFDSAWYLAVTKDVTNTEFATAKLSVVHNGSDAFISHSNVTQTGTNSHMTTDADISGSDVRLKGTGVAASNLIKYYRIGLGDNDSTGSQANDGTGKGSVIINTDIDSAVETLDSWAHASYRGAKYFISVNNASKTENGNIECIVTHNGSDAFILSYGETFSGDNSLITLTATISGSNVLLWAAGGEPNLRVHAYRILLGDAESDTTSGDLKLIGAETVSNNLETTIDSNTARGTNTADFSSAKSVSEFTNSAFDSAWYHIVWKDQTNTEWTMNKYSLVHGTTSDGSTKDAFISDSHIVRTGNTPITTVDADISSGTVRIRGTGYNDGSTTVSNVASYYKIGLGDSTSTATSGKISTHAGVTIGGNNETRIDLVTASGTTTTMTATERTVASFTAGSFDSAWYYVVTKDINGNSVETQKISLMHNASTAFITSSGIVQTDPADQHPIFTADITSGTDSTSTVRLRATDSDGSSVSSSNTMAYYRIGLGDDDSTGYVSAETDEASIEKTAATTIGSTITTLDSWGGASYTAAKYFISIKNTSTGEVGNMEALLTHDNTDAYVSVYNEHYSGNNSLLTITADYSGGARLRAVANAGDSTRVSMYRIFLADTEGTDTETNTRTIANVTVSSAATAIDTFLDGSGSATGYDACHYIITGQNGADEKFVTEATVVTDGTNAYISQHGNVSTKGTPMLELTAAHDGSSTVTVSASSTSGGSTLVNAWRINLKAPANQVETIDSWAYVAYAISGASFVDSFSINSQEDSPLGMAFNNDGTKMFVTGSTGDDINEYALSTGFDVSTASFTDSVSVSSQDTFPSGLAFNTDGTKMFVVGGTGVDINEYTLSVGFDMSSTVTFVDAFSVSSQEANPRGITFNTDGTKMFVCGWTGDDVNEYTLSTGFDVSSASFVDAFSVSDSDVRDVKFSPDGKTMFVLGRGNEKVYQYTLTTGFDVSTAGSVIDEINVASQDTSATGLEFNTEGTKMFILGAAGKDVNEYTITPGFSAPYRGAKYYISMDDETNGYTTNLEALVTHNTTDAFISTYNEHSTNVSLATFSASLSGINVIVTAISVNPDVKIRFYKIMLGDNETSTTGTDINVIGPVTVSSASTALDTFDDTVSTGAHYVVVGYNSGESGTPGSISEVTVLTDGTTAYVAHGPEVSTKGTPQLNFTAAHDGSSTVTLSATSTSGGSTTVNAYRIHMLRGNGTTYTELDSFASTTYSGAHYIIVGKNASNESMITELTAVTDGTGAYHTLGPQISTHSTTTDLMTFTTAYAGGELKLRAINIQEGTSTTVNMYRVGLLLESTEGLDSWSASTYRGAKYLISMNAAGSNEISNIEAMITHNGTTPSIAVYNEHRSGAASLVTLSTDISGGNIRLRAAAVQANTRVTMYRVIFDDSESGSESTDTKITATATVSSTATAIDTFDDTSVSGAHYFVVGWNATESAASMAEVTVVTDGTNAYVSSFNALSTKETDQLAFTATHDGSSTVTLLAASTSGSSTVVNAFRIHLYRDTGTSYDELDSWPANADGSTSTYNGAHYIVVGKNVSNESQIAELTTVSDGTGAYITTNASISSNSVSTELMTFTTAFESGELKLRATNTQDNTTSTVNMYRVALTRATGDTSTNIVLDEFDSTVWRAAKYNVQISDEANSKYELFEANVTHDGTTPYLSMFGTASSETTDLATITVVKSGDNIQLKGEISTTDDHVVKFVRRVIAI